MHILLTGATGYIGKRLLTVLAEEGHQITALVRSARRLSVPSHLEESVTCYEGDLLNIETLKNLPKNLDAAYYLVHSMGSQASGFSHLEEKCAQNFMTAIKKTELKQILYLSGLSYGNAQSEHMSSRHHVEKILSLSSIPLTTFRAGIIIGAGSASFEIIRDLVEKLPIMVAPRWVYSKCQPIGIVDVLYYLKEALYNKKCYGKTLEMAGPETMTYREILLRFAEIRGLKRLIIPVPLLTPYLSSLWLLLITSVNFSLARALVNSLKIDAISTNRSINTLLPHKCMDFTSTIHRAFEKIEQNAVVSSWKDALVQSKLNPNLIEYIEVPEYGCFKNACKKTYGIPKTVVLERLWKIGGKNGWYTMDWAWALRGGFDKIIGGVGLRRGRTHPTQLQNGDVLDFWRVLSADKEQGHLLLYAEMKLPGEAWLEWKISEKKGKTTIEQTATFRPKGVLGRLYWYLLVPAHLIIFPRICNALGKKLKDKT